MHQFFRNLSLYFLPFQALSTPPITLYSPNIMVFLFLKNKQANEQTQSMESRWYWLPTLEHWACSGMQLLSLVPLHWKKNDFSFPSTNILFTAQIYRFINIKVLIICVLDLEIGTYTCYPSTQETETGKLT